MDGYCTEPSTVQSFAPGSRIQSASKLSNCPINNLPDSLLIEILIRLPSALSATRCKSVCKLWSSLISTHYFVHSFLRHHNNNTSKTRPFALILNYLGPQYKKVQLFTSKEVKRQFFNNSCSLKLTYLPCFDGVTCILATFNDLLLCCKNNDGKKDHSVYYICNPLTWQCVALPPTPRKYMSGTIQLGFICDQYAYRNDQEEYRYAVMRIHVLTSCLAVEVFSSETGKWTEFNTPMSSPEYNYWNQNGFSGVGIAYNGMLHWLGVRGTIIIAYNPYAIEHCRFIDCSGVKMTRMYWNSLGVSCGFLRILQLLMLPAGAFRQKLKVWELKDYNTGEWRLIYKVNLAGMISHSRVMIQNYGKLLRPISTLNFHPNNGDIVYLKFAHRLVSWNMLTRELKVVSAIPFNNRFFSVVLPWWPTPVPILPHNALS